MSAVSERNAVVTGSLVFWGRRLGMILSFAAGWEGFRALVIFFGLLELQYRHPEGAAYLPSVYWNLVPVGLWGAGLVVGIALSRATGARLDNLVRQPTPGSLGWKLDHNRTYLVWMRRICFALMIGNGAEMVRAIWNLDSLTSLMTPGHCCEWSSVQTPLTAMLACALGISYMEQRLHKLDHETASP